MKIQIPDMASSSCRSAHILLPQTNDLTHDLGVESVALGFCINFSDVCRDIVCRSSSSLSIRSISDLSCPAAILPSAMSLQPFSGCTQRLKSLHLTLAAGSMHGAGHFPQEIFQGRSGLFTIVRMAFDWISGFSVPQSPLSGTVFFHSS